jgi:hypothetical protein
MRRSVTTMIESNTGVVLAQPDELVRQPRDGVDLPLPAECWIR